MQQLYCPEAVEAAGCQQQWLHHIGELGCDGIQEPHAIPDDTCRDQQTQPPARHVLTPGNSKPTSKALRPALVLNSMV